MLPGNTLDRDGTPADFLDPDAWNRCLHPLEDRERRPTGAIWQAQYADQSILAGPYPDGPLTTQTTLASAPVEIALGFDSADVLYLAWQDEAGVWLWQEGDVLRLLGCTSPRLTRDGEDDLLFFYYRPDNMVPGYTHTVYYRGDSDWFSKERAVALVPDTATSLGAIGMNEDGRLQLSFCGCETGGLGLFAFRVPVSPLYPYGESNYYILEPNLSVSVAGTLIGQTDNWRLFQVDYLEVVDGTPLYSIATEDESGNWVSTLVDRSNPDIDGNISYKGTFYKRYSFHGTNFEKILDVVEGDTDYEPCFYGWPRYVGGELLLSDPGNSYWAGDRASWLGGYRLDREGNCVTVDGSGWNQEVTWMRGEIKNVLTENIAKTPIISPELGMYMDWNEPYLEYQGPVYFGPAEVTANIRCGQYPGLAEPIYEYALIVYATTMSGVTLDHSAVMMEMYLEDVNWTLQNRWYGYYQNTETDLTELLNSVNAMNMLWTKDPTDEPLMLTNAGQYGVWNAYENFNYAGAFMVLQRAYAGDPTASLLLPM